jgi:hypothetical protein
VWSYGARLIKRTDVEGTSREGWRGAELIWSRHQTRACAARRCALQHIWSAQLWHEARTDVRAPAWSTSPPKWLHGWEGRGGTRE